MVEALMRSRIPASHRRVAALRGALPLIKDERMVFPPRHRGVNQAVDRKSFLLYPHNPAARVRSSVLMSGSLPFPTDTPRLGRTNARRPRPALELLDLTNGAVQRHCDNRPATCDLEDSALTFWLE